MCRFAGSVGGQLHQHAFGGARPRFGVLHREATDPGATLARCHPHRFDLRTPCAATRQALDQDELVACDDLVTDHSDNDNVARLYTHAVEGIEIALERCALAVLAQIVLGQQRCNRGDIASIGLTEMGRAHSPR